MSSQRLALRCKPCQEGEKHRVLDMESVEATKWMQFGENVAHEEFFTDALSDWVGEALEGHSLIILLYGLPSSGKSYTAFGSPGESRSNPKARGIIVRCMDEFIKTGASKNNIAQIKGSFYHITSRGQVADLLDAKKRNLQTKRINDKFIFPGATKQSLTTTQDVVNLLEKAQLMRNATGVLRSDEATKSLNPLRDYKPHSTHAVFHYTIESCNNDSRVDEVFVSQLIIVDLAGSQIKKFHAEDSICIDNGLTALHNTLLNLSSSDHEAATESCLSTSLTQLLFPGFFGNSRLILINTLLMNDTEEHTTRKMINFCKGLYDSKAVSSPVCLMLSQTDLGSKMIKTDSLKRTILQELNVSNEQNLNLEIISQTAVSVNGMVFEQLPVQSLQAIVTIRDIERERLSKQPLTQPSVPSYSARVNTLPPLKVEAQKANHTSSLLPNNQPLPLRKAPLVPLIKPSSLPKIKPQVQISSSSSSSDSEDDKTLPVVSSNNVACPPPLNDIPHVLPRVLPLKQPQTNGLLPPANAVLKPIKPLRSRLHSPTSNASIKVEPSLSSSSSSTSVSKGQPKKRHRRRKSKLTKSNRSPSPVKHQTTTSSSDDEDTFDPSFKPGRLSFHPQTLRQENIQREPVRPVISFSGIKNITSNVPTEEFMSNYVLPSYQESSQNEPEQVNNELMSQHELHQSALFKGNRSHLKKLVMKYGIDYKDEGGHTALMYSVLGNQTKICESLINMGADVNATDNANLTALFWAVYHARPEIIKILLRNGADVHITDPHGRSVFHWVMKTPNAFCLKVLCKHVIGNIENQTDMEGLTPLHWAVMCEQHQHISTLLSCVPTTNVCAQDHKGRTPLNYAVLLFSPICIKAILESRPIAATFADFKGRTALHYACAEGSVDCVRALLACKSCDLHCQDNSGTTPLHWAAAANQPGIIQLLLRRGADRGERDASDMTPLDHANQRNHTECIKLLESYGLLRQSSSWSIASQFSIHPPTPPELDEHGHVPMKRPSSSTSNQHLPQDISLMNPGDHCRHNGLRLPADGHSNSTQEEQSLLPTEDQTQQQLASGEEAALTAVSRTNVSASCFNWKQKLRKILSIFSRHNVRVAPA